MRLRVLGPIEVDGDAALGPRDRVVLAALAVRPGDPLSSEVIADALWSRGPPVSWPKVVQGCVSRLRRLLGRDAIDTTPAGYRLVPARVPLDRDEFETLLARGREYAATGSPERAANAFREALRLWRGTPFAELEEWMPGRLEAARLNELRLAAQDDLLQARLDAGDHAGVAVEGTVLVGEEPWRERRWALLALAQYRCGRQTDALACIRTARRALGDRFGLDPGSDLVDLERAILAQDPQLAAEHEARASTRCPWRGLASYDAEDSDTFFGRTADVEACLARLEESPLLALVGPSGSGKSSLMKAGLVPALRGRALTVVTFTPGTDPVAAASAARATVPGDPVLCVDQFEEAFTGRLDRSGLRDWLAELGAYAVERRPVVLTVRSDYLAEFAAAPAFADILERGLHLVAPLSEAALRETIEGPARVAGLRLEHGLVDLLLRDAADQPGALPLLSHALAETWRRREGALLTVEGYRASGGISGAVAASADRLCDSLSDAGRVQLRWLMLRMGSLAEHGEPVRTPLPRQVAADEPERARVLDLLIGARLVTSADGKYELAHESLIRAWPQLRGWLEEDRAGQRLWRHLALAAAEWDALQRPDSELYQGVRLEAALQWADGPDAQPTRLEREFLAVSGAQADAERRVLAEQALHERHQNRRLRGLLVGVAALLLFALAAALLAVDRGRTAADERDVAQQARQSALHESLVGTSLTLRSTKRAVAALLAAEAWRAKPDALSESALLGTFTEAPGFLGYTTVPYRVIQGDTVPGTRSAVIASGTRVRVVDLATGALGPLFDHPLSSDKPVYSVVQVSGDGRRVAQLLFDPDRVGRCGTLEALQRHDGRGCTVLTVFDLATGKPVFGPVVTPVSGGDLAIDRTGGVVAVTGGFNGDLVTYDVDRGRLLGRLAGYPRPTDAFNVRDTGAVELDGRGHVYLGSLRGPVRKVDARTLDVLRTYPAPRMSTHNFLDLTGSGLIVAAGDEALVGIDSRTGERRWYVDLRDDPDQFPCFSFAVADRMGRFYCGSENGEIEERDLRTGQLTGLRLDSQLGQVGDLTVGEGNELVEFSRGHFYRWRLDGSGPISTLVGPGRVSNAGYDPTGRYLELTPIGIRRPHDVLDLRTGARVLRVDRDADARWLGARTLLLRDDRVLFVDPVTGRRWRPKSSQVEAAQELFPGADGGHAWAAIERDERGLGAGAGFANFDVREFELPSGRLTGRTFSVPGYPYLVQASADGRTAWVNFYTGNGSWLTWEDELGNRGAVVDVDGGRPGRDANILFGARNDRDGHDRVVGSDYVGEIREFDPDSMEPVATLPGAKGAVRGLRFSDDGRRLVSSSADGWVQVFDTAAWTRLGAIAALTRGSQEGWLRPDGRAVAVNGRLGVAVWDLDPAAMAAAACTVAGRNLTRTEWATYLREQPYRRTCPAYPEGE